MTGHTPWSKIKHKTRPTGKKVITYQEFVILERWKFAFAYLHTKKKKPWRRVSLYWGKL